MQKKYIVLLLLLFPVCLCNCQSIIDTVSYRFVYDVQAKVFERSAKEGDIIEINTDGLTNTVDIKEIERIITENDDNIAEKLIEEANANGGIDNITTVIIKI